MLIDDDVIDELLLRLANDTKPQFPLPRRLVGSATRSFLMRSFDTESKCRGHSIRAESIF